MKKWLVLFLFAVPALSQQWSTILAPARAYPWETYVGISGGIPSSAWTVCTLYSGSPTPMPSSSTAAQIKAALTACNGTNTYVPLASGTFSGLSGIRNQGISGVELRGQGPQSTHLNFSSGTTCQGGASQCSIGFEMASPVCPSCGAPTSYNWTAGYAQGATSITLSSAAGIGVGTVLALNQCDTGYSGSTCTGGPSVDNGQYFNALDAYNVSGPSGISQSGPNSGQALPHRFQVEYVTVTSCSPTCNAAGTTTFGIAEKLAHPNWIAGQTPQAWFFTPIKNVGVRDLSIDGTSTTGDVSGISFMNAQNYWVTNVVISNFRAMGFQTTQGTHGVAQSNYFYGIGKNDSSADPSGLNYGGSFNLFTNNIFQNSKIATFGNGPATSNVISYNVLVDAWTGNGFLFGSIWDGHSNGADYNLFEGNTFSQILQDQVHGDHDFETYYRNFITGWESCANGQCGSDPFKTNNVYPVGALSFNRYGNWVGNVLGTPGVHTVAGNYSACLSDFNTFAGTGVGTGTYIYQMGTGNGNGPPMFPGGPIPCDSVVGTTSMRWGNYDVANAAVLECTTAGGACPANERGNSAPTYPALASPSTTFPASFYLTARPSWWSGSLAFPAAGPDVTSGNIGQCNGTLNVAGHYAGVAAASSGQCTGTTLVSGWGGHINATPAYDCYLNQLHGPPDGTGAILPFDAAVCYTVSPTVLLTVSTAGSGTGTITGTNCTTNGYASGTSIGTCTATPGVGSTLASFIGTGSASCSGSTCPPFSLTATSTITATFTATTVATPTFSPTSLSAPGFVTISSTTPSSSCFYTVDGVTTPTTSSVKFIYPLYVAQPQTLKAICSATGFTNSAVATQAFSPTVAKTAFGISAIAASENTVPFPNPNRSLAVEWLDVLVNPVSDCNTYNWTSLDAWVAKSAAKGVVNLYTFSHVPQCANGTTNPANPPTDMLTGDTFFKNFVTAFMNHQCSLSSPPVSPLPSTSCKNFKYLETWNEDNTDLYWTDTYAHKAIMDNDMAHIVYQYCADCVVILGSTSAGGSGFHANGQSGFYDVALLQEATAWAALSPFYAPRGISIHDYWARSNIAPPPMVTTIQSHSDPTCPNTTPNASCYVPVISEFSRITGSAVLANAAIKSWAANLPVYGTEGGYGKFNNLCSTGTPGQCIAGIAEHMYAVAAQNTSTKSIPFDLLYASNTCTSPNDWGCYWNNGSSPQLPAINQVISILGGHTITGVLTSVPIIGGNKWSLQLDSGNAEIAWCDAWTPATCTTTTAFTAQTTLATIANPSGITTATGGSLTLTQAPVLLFNSSQAATPTFSPVAGTYTSTQSVTITTATSGATKCYTTNGATPTSSTPGSCGVGSTQYIGPVSVATSLTIKAIATKAGVTDSAIGSAAYIINPALTWTQTVVGSGTIAGTNAASGSYASGTTIGPLTATAGTGFTFSTWSGVSGSALCSGATNPCPSFSILANSAATATFTINSYTLSTVLAGAGSGTVTGCAGSINYGAPYTCIVTPSPGSSITSVAGCGGSGTSSYTGTMPAANCTVTATFGLTTYTLSTATAGAGTGTITGCAGTLNAGDAYSCTVTPTGGSTLTSVTGCSGSGTTTYAGTMPASNCTVTATFGAAAPGAPLGLKGTVKFSGTVGVN